MSTKGTQIEFDVSEFETQVSDAQEDRIIEAIADSIERLRDQIDDNILNEIFRAEPGRYTMRSNFARDQLDPEPLTKNQFLNPLWTFWHDDFDYEASGFSDEREEHVDYAVSFRGIGSVDCVGINTTSQEQSTII